MKNKDCSGRGDDIAVTKCLWHKLEVSSYVALRQNGSEKLCSRGMRETYSCLHVLVIFGV